MSKKYQKPTPNSIPQNPLQNLPQILDANLCSYYVNKVSTNDAEELLSESLETFSDGHLEASQNYIAPYRRKHKKQIDRYSNAHNRAIVMADYLLIPPVDSLQKRLSTDLKTCGDYLVFRKYMTFPETDIKLHSMISCSHHLLCPFCAMRRAAKNMTAYLSRLGEILKIHPDIKLSMITFTVKNGADLHERFDHLFKSLQKYIRMRLKGKSNSSRNSLVELNKALGAVWSYEFKTGKGSGLWHPHCHMIVLHYDDFDFKKLKAEWLNITGDSHVVNVTPFHGEDHKKGFAEVFKYALKFSNMSFEENWHGFNVLRNYRLLGSFGLFRGIKEPTKLTDEELKDIPYIEFFYDFIKPVDGKKGFYKLSKKHIEVPLTYCE